VFPVIVNNDMTAAQLHNCYCMNAMGNLAPSIQSRSVTQGDSQNLSFRRINQTYRPTSLNMRRLHRVNEVTCSVEIIIHSSISTSNPSKGWSPAPAISFALHHEHCTVHGGQAAAVLFQPVANACNTELLGVLSTGHMLSQCCQ
jgi:hypothetical protein